MSAGRERWGTRIGLILAMAGNAVGLGNFLRFPVQAANNGGGAFLIPYFVSLVLLGIPLMWVEWSLGRYGGVRGHGSTPGILDSIWNSRVAKYVGALGIFMPFIVMVYYTYVESWSLGFTFLSLFGAFPHEGGIEEMTHFLRSYQGAEMHESGMFGNVDTATDRKVIKAAREAIGEDRDLLIDVLLSADKLEAAGIATNKRWHSAMPRVR